MGRRAILLVAAGLAALAITGGAALADNITCTANPCLGTPKADTITGTSSFDEIHGGAGKDFISAIQPADLVFGGKGDDRLFAEGGFDRTLDGDDEVHGGKGDDQMLGAGRDDLFFGGPGRDFIDAREDLFAGDPPINGTDTVKGGPDRDLIQAGDGAVDKINCGPGNRDLASIDVDMDTVRHCEEVSL
jgi:Ca2+-binding RTX toxin-like protein